MGFWDNFEYGVWRLLGHWFGNREQYQKEQNPCVHAVIEWHSKDPENRGYVWYYVRGIKESQYCHAVGYTYDANGERSYYDIQQGFIRLTDAELATIYLDIKPANSLS